MPMRRLMLAGALLLPVAASAHETNGTNGGRVSDAGPYHVELVVKDARVEVFVSDAEERPVRAVGFKGTAVLMVDGKPQRIALEPREETRLSGTAPAPLPPDAKGAVQLTAPDGKTAQARFN